MRITISKDKANTALSIDKIIHAAVAEVNHKYLSNPIDINDYNPRSKRVCTFTLRCRLSSRIPPARKSASGRHSRSVSWQAHYEFMLALYAIDTYMHIHTGIADYYSRVDFLNKAPATYSKNVGSVMQPKQLGDLDVA